MSFVLSLPETYKWPLEFRIPADGDYTTVSFTAVFKYGTKAWLAALAEKAKKDEMTQDQFIAEVLVGWEGIKNPAYPEQDLEFSSKSLKDLLRYPAAGQAITDTFWDSQNGAFRKN